ncbi:unnamed protein product [Fusarium graminearum]|nr:unnamed protein product [Fusarium graminearum]CAF3573392.1 unnamed protein product [Fusarium graminearum]CAG1969945.1 unnamed protein product [Fusarium graminearum]CAG2001944.1 unnamed protein product [Fusarium graminearum]CAG2002541.1 unnamed protein product [Fusarium graminearum]
MPTQEPTSEENAHRYDENNAPNAPNAYALSKALAKRLVIAANSEELYTSVIRIPGIYGKYDDNFIPQLVSSMREKEHKMQVGNNTKVFEFLYVNKAAEAHIMAMKALLNPSTRDQVGGEDFFISDGKPQGLFDFCRRIYAAAGSPVRPEEVTSIPLSVMQTMASTMEWVYWVFTLGTIPKKVSKTIIIISPPVTMSFGYAVGDVIAVLGLFERIAIELRNYKDAPVHFQQLRAELDLVHSTLKHVLSLESDCKEELQTLEQIRAIVIHCSQPLQAMVNKMRSKESSLGHFKSTRNLGAIGERLHWSMIAQGDVDSVRKMIMSQMAAINILMSVQQLLTKCSKEMVEAIGRNTRSLLDISGQLRRILKAIEAIPLHLTLDIVRLDDAHGESWALPLQACQTWDSFCDLLRSVVYPNGRPGANHIMDSLFAVTHAKTGRQVQEDTWSRFVSPGFHIEQAMVVKGIRSLEIYLDPTCLGKLVEEVLEYGRRKTYTTCSLWVMTNRAPSSLVVLNQDQSSLTAIGENSEGSRNIKAKLGPGLLSINVNDDSEMFRKVKVVYPTKPVRNINDVLKLLYESSNQPEAQAFIGFQRLRDAEETLTIKYAEESIDSLKIAIESDSIIAEYWYQLGSARMLLGSWSGYHAQYDDATDDFRRCDELMPGLPQVRSQLEPCQRYVQDLDEKSFRDHFFEGPIETPLQTHYEMADQAESEHINFNSILHDGVQESEDSDEEIDHL